MRLREAVERGDGDAVQQELDAGVPVDAAGRTRWTPLHRAVDRGHVHIVRMLCAANANPNVRTETGGDTPMHIAASKGDTASVSELLRVGADPRLKAKNGERPRARIAGVDHWSLLSQTVHSEWLDCNGKSQVGPLYTLPCSTSTRTRSVCSCATGLTRQTWTAVACRQTILL